MEKIDHLWNIYKNIQESIKFADQKIQILLVISGLFSAIVFEQLLENFCLSIFQKIFIGVYIIEFILFIVISLIALLARSDRATGSKIARLIYFNHIAERREANEYYDLVSNTEPLDIQKDLAYQIYEVSQIAKTKYKFYKIAWVILLFQIVSFLSLVIGRLF